MTQPDQITASTVDRLACGRLINTWLREKHPELAMTIAAKAGGGSWEIPVGNQSVVAVCKRCSPGGFHAWEENVLLRELKGSIRRIDSLELAGIMLDSIEEATPDTRKVALERIERSIEISHDHAAFQSTLEPVSSGERAERSLWFGHPFHPLAKSVAGFVSADFRAYSPERGATFRLCWLLAEPDQVETFVCSPESMARADALLADVSGLSAALVAGRTIIPCHPWQAQRLRDHPDLRSRLASGKALQLLGPSGEVATPTSSVRTVWFSERGLFVKLPLEARITNFSRVNTAEQLARSIAGARAVAAAEREVRGAGLSILKEPGGRILRCPSPDGGGAQRTCAETGFLLRFADFPNGVDPIVIAGFAEPDPRTARPNLSSIAGRIFDDPQRAHEWVERYAAVVLLPLIRLFATTGICLEAHAQNSLVAFENGWPARLFVRDLEGMAVDRERFRRAHPEIIADLDDTLFYDRDIAWRRFLYYVIVNHFAHVLSAASELSGVDEARLWEAGGRVLEKEAGAARTLIDELLSAPSLPAKANLSSCVAGRGENPDYVMIANPFMAVRSSGSQSRANVKIQLEKARSR